MTRRAPTLLIAVVVAALGLVACGDGEDVDLSAEFDRLQTEIQAFVADLEVEADSAFRTSWSEFQREWDALRAEVGAGTADVDTTAVEARLAELEDAAARAGGELEQRWAALEDRIRDALENLRD